MKHLQLHSPFSYKIESGRSRNRNNTHTNDNGVSDGSIMLQNAAVARRGDPPVDDSRGESL